MPEDLEHHVFFLRKFLLSFFPGFQPRQIGRYSQVSSISIGKILGSTISIDLYHQNNHKDVSA